MCSCVGEGVRVTVLACMCQRICRSPLPDVGSPWRQYLIIGIMRKYQRERIREEVVVNVHMYGCRCVDVHAYLYLSRCLPDSDSNCKRLDTVLSNIKTRRRRRKESLIVRLWVWMIMYECLYVHFSLLLSSLFSASDCEWQDHPLTKHVHLQRVQRI